MRFLIKLTLLVTILGSANFNAGKLFLSESFEKIEKSENNENEKDLETTILSAPNNFIFPNSKIFQKISQNKLKNIYLKNISLPPDCFA